MAEKLITPSQLRNYASNIDGINSNFNALMKEMQNTMHSMKREYESEAATAFINQFNKLEANVQGYSRVIKEYSNYLTTTAQQFDEVDKRIETNTQSVTNTNLFN